jgi:serine/threonine-protein kinase
MSDGLVLQVGRYGLFGTIAAGGMAEVHFGRQAGTGGFQKTIAIKRLLPHVSSNPDFRSMIYEEARIASRIRHPNVVQPLDVIATDDEVLLAMEYVHGEALSKLIVRARKRGEKLPPAIGMTIVCEMLQGLHAAHEAKDEEGRPLGIVHRDVSPQNVIVGVDGVARVIDFGIAKAVTSTDSTRVGQVKGKLPYIAPEQFAGAAATRSSDIYAGACIAWEVLVGRRLFDGDSDQAVAARILHAPVDPPSAFAEGVPPELDAIVMRGLDRDPTKRFPTAREMALAIEQTMSTATASTVGAYVEHLAQDELQKRAEQLARVERMRFDFTPEPVSSKRAPTTNGLPDLSAIPASGPPPNPALASTVPAAEPIRVPAWKAEVKLPAAGTLKKPELEIPNVNWLPTDGAKAITVTKTRRVSGSMFALVALLIAVAGFWVALPTIVQRGYEKSAAAQGIVLVIGRTDVSRREITLQDVGITIPDLPWVTAHAASIHVELQGIDPRAISVRGLDVTANGGLVDVEKEIDRWRAVHKIGTADDVDAHRRPKLTVEDARVKWNGALGKTTIASAEGVTFEAYGDVDATHAHAPLVKVAWEGGAAGPFRVDYDRTPLNTVVSFRFDPTGARSQSLVVTVDPTGAAQVDANMPRLRGAELWLPPAFGVAELTLTINARIYPGGRNDGSVHAIILTDSAQELRFDASLTGASSKEPLGVSQGTAQIAVAPPQPAPPTTPWTVTKLRPGGTFSFGPAGLDLSFFAVCESKPDASLAIVTLDTKDAQGTAQIFVAKDVRCGKAAGK